MRGRGIEGEGDMKCWVEGGQVCPQSSFFIIIDNNLLFLGFYSPNSHPVGYPTTSTTISAVTYTSPSPHVLGLAQL